MAQRGSRRTPRLDKLVQTLDGGVLVRQEMADRAMKAYIRRGRAAHHRLPFAWNLLKGDHRLFVSMTCSCCSRSMLMRARGDWMRSRILCTLAARVPPCWRLWASFCASETDDNRADGAMRHAWVRIHLILVGCAASCRCWYYMLPCCHDSFARDGRVFQDRQRFARYWANCWLPERARNSLAIGQTFPRAKAASDSGTNVPRPGGKAMLSKRSTILG